MGWLGAPSSKPRAVGTTPQGSCALLPRPLGGRPGGAGVPGAREASGRCQRPGGAAPLPPKAGPRAREERQVVATKAPPAGGGGGGGRERRSGVFLVKAKVARAAGGGWGGGAPPCEEGQPVRRAGAPCLAGRQSVTRRLLSSRPACCLGSCAQRGERVKPCRQRRAAPERRRAAAGPPLFPARRGGAKCFAGLRVPVPPFSRQPPKHSRRRKRLERPGGPEAASEEGREGLAGRAGGRLGSRFPRTCLIVGLLSRPGRELPIHCPGNCQERAK